MKRIIPFLLLAAAMVFCGCVKIDVYVKPATANIMNVVVDDQPIAYPGEHVEINKLGNTVVSWEYNGEYESESIEPDEKQDGETWTVYAGYVETY